MRIRTALVVAVSILWVGCSDGGSEEPERTDDATSKRDTATADVTEGSDASIDPVGNRGPGRVLDVESARYYRDLDNRISEKNSGDIVVRGPGFRTEVFEVDFQYTSQTLWGRKWRHQATLFVPDEINPRAPSGAFVIVQAGTKNPVAEVSDQNFFRNNYAASVAAGMGVPALVVGNMPGPVDLREAPDRWQGRAPARCFSGGLPRERYTPCLLQILRRTGDPTADPFRHLAYAWMRAVTAGIDVMRIAPNVDWAEGGSPIDWSPERAVILADGSLAVAARMAAAADIRIDGVFGNADFAKLSELLSTMRERWSSDYGWFGDPAKFRQWLASEPGRRWLETVDPAEWSGLLEGMTFVHSRGTNDPRFPLGSGALVAESFPGGSPGVTAPDYGAGIGSSTHLSGWYGFVAHVYLDLPWSRVSLQTNASGGNVEVQASIEGEATAKSAVVDWLQQQPDADDLDFRDTVWQTTEMSSASGGWSGQVAPIVDNHAIFVRATAPVDVPTVLEEPATWTIEPAWASPVEIFDGRP